MSSGRRITHSWLPAATRSNVGLFGTGQAYEAIVAREGISIPEIFGFSTWCTK